MTYQVTIAGEPVLDIYECENARCWFVTKKVRKAGQHFLSGYVRCFKPSMLAEFHHLPEEVLNDPQQAIRKVARDAWWRCPCVDVKEDGGNLEIMRCDGGDSDARPLDSCSNDCKEVDEKMDENIKEKLGAYLELFQEIKQKTNDERTAVTLLQEISKDRRMEQIRNEREANNSSPATDKQKLYMKRLGIDFPDKVTKKEASMLIDEELAKNNE